MKNPMINEDAPYKLKILERDFKDLGKIRETSEKKCIVCGKVEKITHYENGVKSQCECGKDIMILSWEQNSLIQCPYCQRSIDPLLLFHDYKKYGENFSRNVQCPRCDNWFHFFIAYEKRTPVYLRAYTSRKVEIIKDGDESNANPNK